MSETDQQSLVSLLGRLAESRNDAEAWRLLYLATWPLAAAVAAHRLRGAADLAEDVAQEAFLRILRYAPFSQLQEPDHFRRYLSTVTRHVADTHLRRYLKRREHERPADNREQPTAKRDGPQELASGRELARKIAEGLKPAEQRLLRLVLDGCDLAEIAALTGVSYAAAATRLSRIREKIRNSLAENELWVNLHGEV